MLLVNNYNPYLMNTEILKYHKYLASPIQHALNVTCKQIKPIPDSSPSLDSTPGMLLANKYNPYLIQTEILNYYKYRAFSIQHAWNATYKQLHPILDEYRNLELL